MAEYIRMPTRSVGLKFLLVCLLALVMAVPIGFVWAVGQDRQNRFNQVRDEIARYEGGQQTILGPVLLVPYEKTVRDQEGKITTLRGEATVFPETGDASAKLETAKKKRAIYTVPVYQSTTDIKAHFDPGLAAADLASLNSGARYDWTNARIVMAVSGTTGFRDDVVLTTADGKTRPFKPIGGGYTAEQQTYDGRATTGAYPGGMSLIGAAAGDLVKAPFDVSTRLELAGAERFAIAAFAKDTSARISAAWPHPSFEGGFLPDEKQISEKGFDAKWRAPLVRRGIASVADDTGVLQLASNNDFAVRFVEPTNVYTGVNRALKYSMMFIGLVFLTYFLFEIVSGGKAHPAQYLMIGLSQAIFYLLLLAFAEQLGFTTAFIIGAGATIALISLYAGVVFKKRSYVVPAFLVFLGVYALMYVLMQQEDYALLIGAVMSFGALAALMYLTRNVAWYGASEEQKS